MWCGLLHQQPSLQGVESMTTGYLNLARFAVRAAFELCLAQRRPMSLIGTHI